MTIIVLVPSVFPVAAVTHAGLSDCQLHIISQFYMISGFRAFVERKIWHKEAGSPHGHKRPGLE